MNARSRGPILFVAGIAVAAVTLVALVAAGVFNSGHEVDEAAWQQTLEQEQDVTFDDWPAFRDVWLEACEDDDDQLGLFLAVALDDGATDEYLRTNLQYACPDRLDVVDQVRTGGDEIDDACATAPEERTDVQARLAEAMGC